MPSPPACTTALSPKRLAPTCTFSCSPSSDDEAPDADAAVPSTALGVDFGTASGVAQPSVLLGAVSGVARAATSAAAVVATGAIEERAESDASSSSSTDEEDESAKVTVITRDVRRRLDPDAGAEVAKAYQDQLAWWWAVGTTAGNLVGASLGSGCGAGALALAAPRRADLPFEDPRRLAVVSAAQHEVYIANLVPGHVGMRRLHEHFNWLFSELPEFHDRYPQLVATNGGARAVLKVKLLESGEHAFVKFADDVLATTAISMDGFILHGQQVKVRRPRLFVTPLDGVRAPLDVAALIRSGVLPASRMTEWSSRGPSFAPSLDKTICMAEL